MNIHEAYERSGRRVRGWYAEAAESVPAPFDGSLEDTLQLMREMRSLAGKEDGNG